MKSVEIRWGTVLKYDIWPPPPAPPSQNGTTKNCTVIGGSSKNCTVIGQLIGGVVLRSASGPVSGSYSPS